ncbi:clostripain-related cysteine peptidase [Parabacteroides timonensis]|uniref:clostripain-related cysteine peptidase n=1 Tax=Parabacteroides timonensis TaxID=1871013 RepID=UPI000A9BC624|nr:clostripain-related cysteine peptidase [Parabacteroides timonensis]
MMKTKYFIYILLIILAFGSCTKEEFKEDGPKRTVLMYVVASNLGSNINKNIEDMISVATPKNLNGGNLIVYYSKSDKSAELYQIKEGTNGIVTKHHIEDYTNQSAIDPEVMKSIISRVATDFPADSYGMIFSSHGTSWLPSNYKTMLRSFGEEAGYNMEIYELAEGIPDEYHFDFLLFDVCSMGGVECVYELKDKADYIVASPAEVLAAGFPYKEVLPYLFETKANLDGVAKGFYEHYKNNGNPFGCIAVTKTSELNDLAAITKEIITAKGGEEGTYSLPYSDIQTLSYLPSAPTRLYDLSDLIKHLATDEQFTRFTDCMDKAVTSRYSTDYIYCSKGGDTKVNTFSGLSIYPLQKNLTQLNDWYRNNTQWYKAVYQ